MHYGEATLGLIGSGRQLKTAVVGDVGNVANRLEALTRHLGVQVVVSDELVQAARVEDGLAAEALLAEFLRGKRQLLRGRVEPILAWTLSRGAGGRRSCAAKPMGLE